MRPAERTYLPKQATPRPAWSSGWTAPSCVGCDEGRYLLRTNLTAREPDALWTFYIQLTEVEQAFKEIKHDLAIRPIFHKTEGRIEAHLFVPFLAYCLQVTLKANLRTLAEGRRGARSPSPSSACCWSDCA